jgi:hypothetical protein
MLEQGREQDADAGALPSASDYARRRESYLEAGHGTPPQEDA